MINLLFCFSYIYCTNAILVVIMFDCMHGALLSYFLGKGITSLCWRPDGKAIALGLDDGTISLHDVEVGKMD